jgi:hypothetical protein
VDDQQITFQEEQPAPAFAAAKKPFMIRLVLASGAATTDEAATYVLLGVAGVVALLAIGVYLAVGSGRSSIPPATPSSSSWPQPVTQ